MEDVTDFVFREIVAGLPRPDVMFTEFTNAEGLMSKGKDRVIRKLKYSENQRPIVAQIWGLKPEVMNGAAKLVQELGFDGIDINMGCPERSVVKRGAGAGLIKNQSLAAEQIAAVREGANELPLSVKTRIGVGQVVTKDWITFLLEQKLDALTIHGRTARQMSLGEANWEEVGKAVKIRDSISPDTIIIGNGDIKNYSQASEMRENYGIDGVMIARGIFSDPWVFEKEATEANHSKDEYLEILLRHVKLYDETWGKTKNFAAMKKFFKMYVKNFDGANELRMELMEAKNVSEVEKILIVQDS
jgi:nifR3 family TIM-barrel protein